MSSPLAKRQKVTLPTELRQASSVPKELARHMIDLNHPLSIYGATGLVEVATTSTIVSRMIHTLNVLGGDLWSRLSDDNTMNLLDFGIHTSVMVRTPTLVCVYPFLFVFKFILTFFYSVRTSPVFSSSPRYDPA